MINVINRFIAKISQMYNMKVEVQDYFDECSQIKLNIIISEKLFADELVVIDFQMFSDEPLKSTITRFKQIILNKHGNSHVGKFGMGIDFDTIFKKVFSTYLIKDRDLLSVFFTDHQPQFRDLSCNKVYSKGNFKGSSWMEVEDVEHKAHHFHNNNIERVKQAMAHGIKYQYSDDWSLPEVEFSNQLMINIPRSSITNDQMSLSYVDTSNNDLTVLIYKFYYDNNKKPMRNWALKYNYSISTKGLLSIKTSDTSIQPWMKSIESDSDFEEHPYNCEIHGKLGEMARPIYIGDKVWVTSNKRLFIKICNIWTPINSDFIHHAEKFLPTATCEELQMTKNMIYDK